MSSQVLSAYKWSFLTEALTRLIAPLMLLVLARLLTPEDFGVVATATVLISFAQALCDGGLGKALIQRKDENEASINAAFWLSLGVGSSLTASLYLLAPGIAEFFNDERITSVTRALSLQVWLTAAASIPSALLLRKFRFRKLFAIRFAAIAAPALVAIPLAMAGFGYWALVASTLISQLLETLILWAKNHWHPHFSFAWKEARELLQFSKWAALSAILLWFYAWMDALIVARYLGPREIGLYRTGNTLVKIAFSLPFAPMLPVAYSTFSRYQDDLPLLIKSMRDIMSLIAWVSFPIGCFIVVFAPEIGNIALGHQWNGVELVLAYMAIMHSLSWLVGINGELYRAIGKPHVETWTTSLTLPLYITGYLISIQWGLEAFLQVRVGLALVALIIHLGVSKYVLGTTFLNTSVAKAIFASLLALAVAKLTLFTSLTMAPIIAAVAFAVAAMSILIIFERDFISRAAQWLGIEATV